jgi:hypothetical protein
VIYVHLALMDSHQTAVNRVTVIALVQRTMIATRQQVNVTVNRTPTAESVINVKLDIGTSLTANLAIVMDTLPHAIQELESV